MTALQYLVVSCLFAGEKSTRELRREVGRLGFLARPSPFRRVLQRLANDLIVVAQSKELRRNGRVSWEHYHRVTDRGLSLWQATRRFYLDRPEPSPNLDVLESDYMDDAEFKRQLIDLGMKIVLGRAARDREYGDP